MNSLHNRKLTDGVIFLRPFTLEDAAEHLAGEDEEMAKWLSGGRSTMANVEKAILNWQQNWQTGHAGLLVYSIVSLIDWSASLR